VGEIGIPFPLVGFFGGGGRNGGGGGIASHELTAGEFGIVECRHPGIVAEIAVLDGRFGGALGSAGAVGGSVGEIGVPFLWNLK
jgi:hypothetical protein